MVRIGHGQHQSEHEYQIPSSKMQIHVLGPSHVCLSLGAHLLLEALKETLVMLTQLLTRVLFAFLLA